MQALHDIKGQGPTLGPPKTESAVRTVPVAESIAVRLAAHIVNYVDEVEPDALVFTSLRGGPLLNTYFAPQWSKATEAVGLRHVRFHDLRHLAGTEAATAGSIAPRGDVDHGPRIERRQPPLPQDRGEPKSRDRRRDRPAHGELTHCSDWRCASSSRRSNSTSYRRRMSSRCGS